MAFCAFGPFTLYAQESQSLYAQKSQSNLLSGASVTLSGNSSDLSIVTTGHFLPEGSPWDSPDAVTFDSSSSIEVALSAAVAIGGIALQADNNDTYVIEWSLNGDEWHLLARAQAARGNGLRTRSINFHRQISLRYLRIRGQDGDGHFSIAKLFAFSGAPPRLSDDSNPPPLLDQFRVDILKIVLGIAGVLLLLWQLVLERAGKTDSDRVLRDRLLLGLGLLAGLAWWNFLYFHFNNYVHSWDVFHYYVGAKYSPELSYNRLYDCATIADAQDGIPDVASRLMRDLKNNLLVRADSVLALPQRCTEHFSPERWQSFKNDVAWFREAIGSTRWPDALKDHGYNGTPVWNILGYLLTNLAPASEMQVLLLAGLDSLLLIVMWVLVWRAFGWRGCCFALLYWGTNFPARFWWTGGGFLRQDWLVWLTIGIVCLKYARYKTAGFLLSYAALLRIFPALVFGGFFLVLVRRFFSRQRPIFTGPYSDIAKGAVLGLVILLPTSVLIANNPNAWGDFFGNSKKLIETPLTNYMGLKTVLSYSPSLRSSVLHDANSMEPFAAWKESRRTLYQERTMWHLIFVLLWLVLLAKSCDDAKPAWQIAVLSLGSIPFMTELTCYYYSFPLLFGLLGTESTLSACILIGYSLSTYILANLILSYDESFTWQSVATLLAVCWITWLFRRRPPLDA